MNVQSNKEWGTDEGPDFDFDYREIDEGDESFEFATEKELKSFLRSVRELYGQLRKESGWGKE